MTPAVDQRETRQFARETKFLIDVRLTDAVRDWARARLTPDGHGSGEHHDEYDTTSLYFDTAAFDVFRKRRSYGRSKYRIRTYATDHAIFLERKFRTETLLAKRRTAVSRSELDLLFGDTPDPAWRGYWFHRRLLVRGLRPMCQVSYRRTARVGAVVGGPIRLTVDDGLRVLPMPDLAFIPGTGLPLLERQAIVEMKYRYALPALFKELIEKFALVPQTLSKYRVGMTTLGFAPMIEKPVLRDESRRSLELR